jgi:hypothetical protein
LAKFFKEGEGGLPISTNRSIQIYQNSFPPSLIFKHQSIDDFASLANDE